MTIPNFNRKERRNSDVIRVDSSLLHMIKEMKLNIAKKSEIDPKFIPNPFITRKIVEWAELGRRFENQPRIKPNNICPKKKRNMDIFVENFKI